jgi:hypothetical protein
MTPRGHHAPALPWLKMFQSNEANANMQDSAVNENAQV